MKATLITDKVLYDYAKGNILTSYGDFELKKYQANIIPGKPTLPAVPGGIFDSKIFGSPYVDRCECGYTTGKGNTCPYCLSHINTEAEDLNAIGLIKSPLYFIQTIAIEAFRKLINETFKSNNLNVKGNGEFFRILYTSFVEYIPTEDRIIFNNDLENISNPDFTNLSIEGVIKIFDKYKKSKLQNLMELVHEYILVRPVSMRPWSYTYKSWLGTRTLDKHQLNFQYQSLIYISTELFSGINFKTLSVEDLVYSFASIRLAITKIVDGINGLIRSSKQSSIREGFGVRIPNSGRCTALADPSLDIDHVSLPISLCFEIFRVQFLNWLSNKYKLTEDEVVYKIVNKDKDIITIFEEFVEESDLYVMINRAPTLYKLSQLVFKVKVNSGSYLGYSLMATTPLNLDFDGDTVAVYEVPEHLKSEVQSMLPSKLNKYMKSDEEVIIPKQETLIGLMIATTLDSVHDKSQEVKVTDVTKLDDMYMEGKFDSNDIITIGTETTTYGRWYLSNLLGFKIDYQINKKNISDLISKMKTYPNFVENMKSLQDFGLKISTYESEEDLSLENLSKSAHKIDKSEYNYNKSELEVYDKSKRLNEEVSSLKDSLKGDKSTISSIVNPQIIYSDGNWILTSDSMLGTLTPNEYVRISTEFRKVQQVKVNSVGESGYLTRQVWTAMSKLVYEDDIQAPEKLLTIIADIDGVRYQNGNPIKVTKGKEYQVDSVIYNLDDTVHKNDLYEEMKFVEGHLIGVDLGMQLGESLTQGILKLKHVGSYITYSNYGLLNAESDCEVKYDDKYIYISVKGEVNKFIKSPKFRFVDPNRTKYSKGDLIGVVPTLVTPDTNLYLLRKLIKALGSSEMPNKPNTYINLYSVTSGIAKFNGDVVIIGDTGYKMPDDSLCLVYEGMKVEVGDKIFTGPLDYRAFINKYSYIGINKLFQIFSNEFKQYINVKSILIEFLFKSIHHIDIVNGQESIVFNGVSKSIDSSKDLLTSLTLGYIKEKVAKYIASNSGEIGDSTIINIAYQFNNLRLGNVSGQKLLLDNGLTESKLIENE